MSRKIKFTIESDLENVSLVGMAVNKLCSLIPMTDGEAFQMELCVVEAVNNSIRHAYGNDLGHEVEIVFELSPDDVTLHVCDNGIPLDKKVLEKKCAASLEYDHEDLDNIPEGGRGLAIIKDIMDTVHYESKNGKNCFTMKKRLAQQGVI